MQRIVAKKLTDLSPLLQSMVVAASWCGDAYHQQAWGSWSEVMDGAKYRIILQMT